MRKGKRHNLTSTTPLHDASALCYETKNLSYLIKLTQDCMYLTLEEAHAQRIIDLIVEVLFHFQVVAEAFTKQPPAARPRPVRRRPTLDNGHSKPSQALSAATETPKVRQVKGLVKLIDNMAPSALSQQGPV